MLVCCPSQTMISIRNSIELMKYSQYYCYCQYRILVETIMKNHDRRDPLMWTWIIANSHFIKFYYDSCVILRDRSGAYFCIHLTSCFLFQLGFWNPEYLASSSVLLFWVKSPVDISTYMFWTWMSRSPSLLGCPPSRLGSPAHDIRSIG